LQSRQGSQRAYPLSGSQRAEALDQGFGMWCSYRQECAEREFGDG
jgi:hypothetical protein